MNKELEALNYLVNLAVVGNKEKHRGKVFESEEIILQALKRNEPMKIDLKTKYALPYSGIYYECPKCGTLQIKKTYVYCPRCRQKLDWSDEK